MSFDTEYPNKVSLLQGQHKGATGNESCNGGSMTLREMQQEIELLKVRIAALEAQKFEIHHHYHYTTGEPNIPPLPAYPPFPPVHDPWIVTCAGSFGGTMPTNGPVVKA